MNKKLIKTFGALAGIGAIASAATFSLTSCGGDSLQIFGDKSKEQWTVSEWSSNKLLASYELKSAYFKDREDTQTWSIRKGQDTATVTILQQPGARFETTKNAWIIDISATTTKWIDTDAGEYNIGFTAPKVDGKHDIIAWRALARITIKL